MTSRHDLPADQDSDELQALFDSIANQASAPSTAPKSQEALTDSHRAFNRVGQMMRQLIDTLRELGYEKLIEQTVHAFPDTRERLAYIANLTEQAACRVLNATDIAMPLQEQLGGTARALSARWHALYANQLSVAEFRQLADDTVNYLDRQVPDQTAATNEQLMNIMMAQDFQDLTGQVIKKIGTLVHDLETQLMAVLVDLLPEERRNAEVDSLLNGPVIAARAGSDVVVSQQQVDDLLDSLGF